LSIRQFPSFTCEQVLFEDAFVLTKADQWSIIGCGI
jgi:hypothetical protein